jgi:hypothetical protein
MKEPRHNGTTHGFSRASSLMQTRIREASESRGFAVSRLLTHWSEVVGDAIADVTRPVEVSYGKGGMGATLTILTTGPQAPMIEMQKEHICERVNACYGYRAIARVRITQTAPTGFAEGQAVFRPTPKAQGPDPDPETLANAAGMSKDIENDDLRLALQTLGAKVLNKSRNGKDTR